MQGPQKAHSHLGPEIPASGIVLFVLPTVLGPHLQTPFLWQRLPCSVVRHWALNSARPGTWVGSPPLPLRSHIYTRGAGSPL